MGTVEQLRPVVDALLDSATIDAVVRDGWPRPMVEAGFAFHRKTWDLERLNAGLQDELVKLEDVHVPGSMTHVWPALPGAGVTPVLAAALLGVEKQRVRPSSRGQHFAKRFAEVWPEVELTSSVDDERVVVSGSDETIASLIKQLGVDKIVGYGSRQSFAIVHEGSADSVVCQLATDIVMWLGLGCFSAHAVMFVGSREAAKQFAPKLAEAISKRERLWHPEPSEAELATRVQEMAVAEFETDVWPASLGWVELRERWTGAPRPANVVVVCPCDIPEDVIELPPSRRQGVAYHGPLKGLSAASLGATRLCAPGELQAPPADWPHDGVSNAAALLGFRSGRIGF